MSHRAKCNLCGIYVPHLGKHIAEAHRDELLSGPADAVAELFGVSGTTIRAAKRMAGINNKRRCPRCGMEIESKAGHLATHHMPLLICARYTLHLRQREIAAMFFNDEFTKSDINTAWQFLYHREDIEAGIEEDQIPKVGVPICNDGNGGIRIMERGEVGRGLIYVDEVLSWL